MSRKQKDQIKNFPMIINLLVIATYAPGKPTIPSHKNMYRPGPDILLSSEVLPELVYKSLSLQAPILQRNHSSTGGR